MAPSEMLDPARRARGLTRIALAVLATGIVLGGLIALGVRYRRDR